MDKGDAMAYQLVLVGVIAMCLPFIFLAPTTAAKRVAGVILVIALILELSLYVAVPA